LSSLVNEEGEKLLLPEAVAFWSEHSDRAGLDSWLSAIGVGSDMRRFVGRWAVRSSEDSYVRTAKRVVENCQRLAGVHARAAHAGGPDFFGEEETLSRLRDFLGAAGVDGAEIDAQIGRLERADTSAAPDPLGSMSDLGALTLPEAAQDAAAEAESLPALDDLVEEDIDREIEQAAEAAETAPDIGGKAQLHRLLGQQVAEELEKPAGFCVSITQGGHCRRLHFVGFCFRVPGEHYKRYESYGQEVPCASRFDVRCKDCFPAGKASERAEEAEQEASDSDGATSASSSSSSSPPLEPVVAS
jgi:hypothetical protein